MSPKRTPKHRAGDPPRTPEELLSGLWHVGRSWTGVAPALEQQCPCTKAPCGLAIPHTDTPCEQHHGDKEIRQAHLADKCKKTKSPFWKKP